MSDDSNKASDPRSASIITSPDQPLAEGPELAGVLHLISDKDPFNGIDTLLFQNCIVCIPRIFVPSAVPVEVCTALQLETMFMQPSFSLRPRLIFIFAVSDAVHLLSCPRLII